VKCVDDAVQLLRTVSARSPLPVKVEVGSMSRLFADLVGDDQYLFAARLGATAFPTTASRSVVIAWTPAPSQRRAAM
jgi:hypothetical protein